jgi:hypothetical protein
VQSISSFHYSSCNRRPLSKLSKRTSKRCIEREIEEPLSLRKNVWETSHVIFQFGWLFGYMSTGPVHCLVDYSATCPLVQYTVWLIIPLHVHWSSTLFGWLFCYMSTGPVHCLVDYSATCPLVQYTVSVNWDDFVWPWKGTVSVGLMFNGPK